MPRTWPHALVLQKRTIRTIISMEFHYIKTQKPDPLASIKKWISSDLRNFSIVMVSSFIVFVFASSLISRGVILFDFYTFATSLTSLRSTQNYNAALQSRELNRIEKLGAELPLKGFYDKVWPLSTLEHVTQVTYHGALAIKSGLTAANSLKSAQLPQVSSENIQTDGSFSPGRIWQEASPSIKDAQNQLRKLDQALQSLSLPILGSWRKDFEDIQKISAEAVKISDNSTLVLELIDMLSSGNKTLLVLFQNNNELRSTGGFIGTYGEIKIENGKLENLKVDSVYNFDGQAVATTTPPKQLLKVNDKWYLRDSNWFVDYTVSSKKTARFYESQAKSSPDCIIAFTPDVFIELLRVTGPVYVPNYDVTLTAENFVETTQVVTSVNYDKEENRPKAMLGDFTNLLIEKLKGQDAYGKVLVTKALLKSLERKDIMLSCTDEKLQKKLDTYNWSGSVKAFGTDYLHINSSNLSGTKTDRYIKDKYSLHVSKATSGALTEHTLQITRNNYFVTSYLTDNYSYYRVLVPRGSTLTHIQGYSPDPIPDAPDSGDYTGTQSSDELVRNWNAAIKPSGFPDVVIGEESDLSYIGFWVHTPGKTTANITLRYTTPQTLEDDADLSSYQLVWQKQPGKTDSETSLRINTDKNVLWHSNNLGKSLDFQGELDKDLVFSAIFK